jgi:hypothetical protein
MFSESHFKLFFACKAHPFFENGSICVQQINFRLIVETQGTLEIARAGIIGIEVGKRDPAEILCFEPMDHGRHRAAGASGKAEEFNKL